MNTGLSPIAERVKLFCQLATEDMHPQLIHNRQMPLASILTTDGRAVTLPYTDFFQAVERLVDVEQQLAEQRARNRVIDQALTMAVLRHGGELSVGDDERDALPAGARVVVWRNDDFGQTVLEYRERPAEATGERTPPPGQREPFQVGTGMPATSHLEAFGQTLYEAFGAVPYHVGSSVHGKTWRDVDVRIMLDDDRFAALFPGYAAWHQRDAWWNLVNSALSELGRVRTGLPIDLKIQPTTEANERFPGSRNPLMLGLHEPAHRPAMLPGGQDGEDR
jgi:hypothetical protein